MAPADSSLALAIGVDPPFHTAFWARVDPGGFISPHIDAGPYWERWHFPVQPSGWFWEETRGHFQPVEPFTVRHWESHAVYNDGDMSRIHFIVDRAIRPPDAPLKGPLVITEMIPEIIALLAQ